MPEDALIASRLLEIWFSNRSKDLKFNLLGHNQIIYHCNDQNMLEKVSIYYYF